MWSVLQPYSNLDGPSVCARDWDTMDGIHSQLEALCEEVERQLKSKLHLQIGNLVRLYLPQTWVFETELGECSIYIDVDGNARVWRGVEHDRDITLIWRYDALAKVLESKNRSSVQPGDYPTVLVQTEKGRAAFNYLKKEFGL